MGFGCQEGPGSSLRGHRGRLIGRSISFHGDSVGQALCDGGPSIPGPTILIPMLWWALLSQMSSHLDVTLPKYVLIPRECPGTNND